MVSVGDRVRLRKDAQLRRNVSEPKTAIVIALLDDIPGGVFLEKPPGRHPVLECEGSGRSEEGSRKKPGKCPQKGGKG